MAEELRARKVLQTAVEHNMQQLRHFDEGYASSVHLHDASQANLEIQNQASERKRDVLEGGTSGSVLVCPTDNYCGRREKGISRARGHEVQGFQEVEVSRKDPYLKMSQAQISAEAVRKRVETGVGGQAYGSQAPREGSLLARAALNQNHAQFLHLRTGVAVVEAVTALDRSPELTEKEQHQFQEKLKDLRRTRVAENDAAVKLQVSKLQTGCWMARDNEKHIEGWQNATLTLGAKDTAAPDALTPRSAQINACKVRMKAKMETITKVAVNSPLSQVPAHEAVHFFAQRIGLSEMDKKTFLEATRSLVVKFNQTVTVEHISEIFQALDIDETGGLDHIEWISSVPLFFGASLEVAKAVFEEIDQDSSGSLDIEEFGDYASTTISMLVPPQDSDLRKKLKKYLAETIFAEIDADGGGTITPEEFTQWSQMHSLGSAAIHCLEEIIRGEQGNAGKRVSIEEALDKRYASLLQVGSANENC